MTVDQERLAAEILDGYTPIDDNRVPTPFADFVAERIAARPSPAPTGGQLTLDDLNVKLDEILTLLKGKPE